MMRRMYQDARGHWCGGCRRALQRCLWVVAGPGRTTSRRPRAHAAAGPGGARNTSGTTQQYQKPCGARARCPWAAATTVSDKSRT